MKGPYEGIFSIKIWQLDVSSAHPGCAGVGRWVQNASVFMVEKPWVSGELQWSNQPDVTIPVAKAIHNEFALIAMRIHLFWAQKVKE